MIKFLIEFAFLVYDWSPEQRLLYAVFLGLCISDVRHTIAAWADGDTK